MDKIWVNELDFNDANKLYDYISVNIKMSPEMVFRGQECSSFGLEPGVVRNNKHRDEIYEHNNLFFTGVDFKSYEYEVLRLFIRACDKSGVLLPNEGNELRKSFGLVNDRIEIPFGVDYWDDLDSYLNAPGSWPDTNSFLIMFMAQHHGLPTRLLDWSGSILTAMYFASVGGMKRIIAGDLEKNSNKEIAIWVLNGKSLNNAASEHGFALIKPPSSVSVNISPQEGFFTTFLRSNNQKSSYVLSENQEAMRHVKKFTLDIGESGSMYEICRRYGYTGAKLFPGLDGAAREANEIYMLKVIKKLFK